MGGRVVTDGPQADVDVRYQRWILGGRAMLRQGCQARQEAVVALAERGMRPPDIARELARQAVEAGLGEQERALLGISEHNVRVMLRRHLDGACTR